MREKFTSSGHEGGSDQSSWTGFTEWGWGREKVRKASGEEVSLD